MVRFITTQIENEKVHLKKSRWGYRVIHPTHDEDGKKIWINILFGGYENLIRLLIIFAIIILLYFGINELISGYKDVVMNPCNYCIDCFAKEINYFPLK